MMGFLLIVRCLMCYLQISSLAMENKILGMKLQESNKHPPGVMKHDNRGNGKESMPPKHDLSTATCSKDKEEVTVASTISSKVGASCFVVLFD